jgi:hypothetical protein
MILPSFECKVAQKIGECEEKLIKRMSRIGEAKLLASRVRKNRQS